MMKIPKKRRQKREPLPVPASADERSKLFEQNEADLEMLAEERRGIRGSSDPLSLDFDETVSTRRHDLFIQEREIGKQQIAICEAQAGFYGEWSRMLRENLIGYAEYTNKFENWIMKHGADSHKRQVRLDRACRRLEGREAHKPLKPPRKWNEPRG